MSDPINDPTLFVNLKGLNFRAITEHECVELIVSELEAGRGGWIVTPNLHILRRYCKVPTERAIIEKADLVVADGMPLIWASRLQGTPLPGRVAGSNMISGLAARAARSGHSVYLLGGAPGTAEAAGRVLQERSPSLRILGHHCPPFGFENKPEELEAIRRAIREAQPDVVFVALAFPKGELLIEDLRSQFSGTWWVGVGISFSFLSGDIKRAPSWMQKTGLEWIHRLVQEPSRLAGRYLVEGVPFAINLLASAIGRRLAGPQIQRK